MGRTTHREAAGKWVIAPKRGCARRRTYGGRHEGHRKDQPAHVATPQRRGRFVEEGAAFAELAGPAPPRGDRARRRRRYDVIVIGAGQAGLSVGYHLAGAACASSSSTPTRASATPGATAGTRCACSRRPATTASTACRSRRRPTASRPRTRWPTTSRPTPSGSTCRSRPGSGSSGWARDGDRYLVEAGGWRLRGRPGRRRHGQLPAPADPRVRRRAGRRHRPAALGRLPQPGAAAGRAGAARRRRQLRRRDGQGAVAATTACGCRAVTPASCRSASPACSAG